MRLVVPVTQKTSKRNVLLFVRPWFLACATQKKIDLFSVVFRSFSFFSLFVLLWFLVLWLLLLLLRCLIVAVFREVRAEGVVRSLSQLVARQPSKPNTQSHPQRKQARDGAATERTSEECQV